MLTNNPGSLDAMRESDGPRNCDNDALPTACGVNLGSPTKQLRCHILLADDGPENQYLIKAFLIKAGATVETVDNGRLAVQQIQAACNSGQPFDVVLMDMEMPKVDGYTATATLRQQGYLGPILALTANTKAEDREKCLAAGCDDYLPKPVQRVRLLERIAICMAGTSSGRPSENWSQVGERTDAQPLISDFAGDAEMAMAVVRFVGRLEAKTNELSMAAAAHDYNRLRMAVHQLKGSAGGYGFTPITDASAAVERRLDVLGETEALEDALAVLVTLCNRARATYDVHNQ